MKEVTRDSNENLVEAAFTAQAAVFDNIYSHDKMIEYKRGRVRNHIRQFLSGGNNMLELNCGTGDDAFYFAGLGHNIHATDISSAMLEKLAQKMLNASLPGIISIGKCSFTRLDQLKNKGPYDYIYSNFGGLNCTGQLETVLKRLTPLIKPGGFITLVIISRFCLWESLLVFKGKFRTAFRRFFSSRGRQAHAEGVNFTCWYYPPSYILRAMQDEFNLVSLEGLCTIVPPSYIAGFDKKYPKIFAFLCKQENKRKKSYPWKYIGDYFIITLRRRC
ncbi:MAG: class I SAM-dependent methyltransferase [Sphingobacteriales bacterium]|nr:MAG: class I SAM-dependent methyltransferase [Sphingobacteriales bacterium]